MNNDEVGDLVQVAVPRKHLIAVYGFLATLEADHTSISADEEPTDPAIEVTWSVADLKQFATTPTATSRTIVKVMNALAKNPNVFMTTTELETVTGVPRANLKGAFSALTRHIKKHYGDQGWMLTFEWGPSMGPTFPAEGHYKLSEDQAARWAEATREG